MDDSVLRNAQQDEETLAALKAVARSADLVTTREQLIRLEWERLHQNETVDFPMTVDPLSKEEEADIDRALADEPLTRLGKSAEQLQAKMVSKDQWLTERSNGLSRSERRELDRRMRHKSSEGRRRSR